jgi:hypothetical protein
MQVIPGILTGYPLGHLGEAEMGGVFRFHQTINASAGSLHHPLPPEAAQVFGVNLAATKSLTRRMGCFFCQLQQSGRFCRFHGHV